MPIKSNLKTILRTPFRLLGYDIQKKCPQSPRLNIDPVEAKIGTMVGALESIHRIGFFPNTIFDVGVAHGTPDIYQVFDQSKYILVDPLEENRPFMEYYSKKFAGSVFEIVAAGSEIGEVTIHVAPQISGSSVHFATPEGSIERKVRVTTLDLIQKKYRPEPPYLLKTDTEGNDLSVLRGATEVLKDSEFVISECPLIGWGTSPESTELIDFMARQGFAIFDLVDPNYHRSSGRLEAVDIIFVKRESVYRFKEREQPLEDFRRSVKKKLAARAVLLDKINLEHNF